MSTVHRPKVERGTDHVGVVYRFRCTCGASREARPSHGLAAWDMEQHITTLPLVPEHQRCRDPRRHGTREWEACPLCEHQEPLFE